jgi:tRNA(Glu) U13 pseudouridine synthase TruD
LNLSFETDGVRLSFSLPAGAYATQLIREITQQDTAEEPEC